MVVDGGVSLEDFLGDRSNRLFASIWGLTGQGKSFLPLSWPRPLHIMNFEPDGPAEAFRSAVRMGIVRSDEEIAIYNPIEEVVGNSDNLIRDLSDDGEIYEWVKDVITDIVKGASIGTLVLDTMSSFYEILRDVAMEDIRKVRVGQGQSVQRFDWGYANKEMKRLVDGIRANSNLNVVCLSHGSPVFNQGRSTGMYRNGGPAKLEQWVDLSGRLSHDPASDLDPDDPYNWCLKLEKCRRNVKLEGTVLWAPSFDRIQLYLDDELEEDG